MSNDGKSIEIIDQSHGDEALQLIKFSCELDLYINFHFHRIVIHLLWV